MKTLTEEAFAHTLKDIMQEKSFDKVTVTELVQHMHVNRQTFYYHFNDLYDLLEKIYISDGEQMIGDNRTDDSLEKSMLAIFQYILANKAFVYNTYYSINRNYLEHFLYDRAYDLIKPVLKAKNPDLSASELDFRVHFCKYGLVGFILDWIDSGLQENPNTLAKRIYQLLNY